MPSYPKDPDRFALRRDYDGDFVLFINGILTRPGDQFGWTDRAERWVGDNTDHEYDALEYFHTPLFGRIFNEGKVYREALALLAGYYASARYAGKEFRPHIVAHSHGCEITRKLILNSGFNFRAVHLFAAAISSDFDKGLNKALDSGKVGEVCLYVSKADSVLKYLPPLSLGLYGRLGYEGPKKVAKSVVERVHVTTRNMGHSEWFAPANFRTLMEEVNARIDDVPV